MTGKYVPAYRKEYTWESENPYYEGKKYPEPTKCPECGAIFKDGRWQWEKEIKETVKEANEALCPACRRKRDRYPGGIIILKGKFFKEHKEEILNRIKNIASDVENLRPLQRILWIEEKEDGTIEIATTSEHLARHIGEGVNKAFKGKFEIKYNENEKFATVIWERD